MKFFLVSSSRLISIGALAYFHAGAERAISSIPFGNKPNTAGCDATNPPRVIRKNDRRFITARTKRSRRSRPPRTTKVSTQRSSFRKFNHVAGKIFLRSLSFLMLPIELRELTFFFLILQHFVKVRPPTGLP